LLAHNRKSLVTMRADWTPAAMFDTAPDRPHARCPDIMCELTIPTNAVDRPRWSFIHRARRHSRFPRGWTAA
jgi:hypothetical protein